MAPRTHSAHSREHVHQDITDISDTKQLLRYALASQLERLSVHHHDVTEVKIAEAARLRNTSDRNAASALSRALKEGPGTSQLPKLDEIIGALDSDLAATGGLTSLYLRLSAFDPAGIQIAHVPPSWTGRTLKGQHPASELDVLAQAAALLSAFTAADRVGSSSVQAVREEYSQQIELLVRRLILISVSPPAPRNYDAQILLGSLACYAFEPTRDWLDSAVRYWPLAFRVWRAITKLVKLSDSRGRTGDLREWVQQLVSDSGELRASSLYPGAGLDLELALAVPADWSPPGNDWVADALLARARDANATIRERGTAAMALWQRALEQDRRKEETKRELRILAAEFQDASSRLDARAGMRWIASTLEHVLDTCRLPAAWDHPEGFSATSMGPPGCQ
jgi:hypothetical protein